MEPSSPFLCGQPQARALLPPPRTASSSSLQRTHRLWGSGPRASTYPAAWWLTREMYLHSSRLVGQEPSLFWQLPLPLLLLSLPSLETVSEISVSVKGMPLPL